MFHEGAEIKQSEYKLWNPLNHHNSHRTHGMMVCLQVLKLRGELNVSIQLTNPNQWSNLHIIASDVVPPPSQCKLKNHVDACQECM
jgi:hypothetical protein